MAKLSKIYHNSYRKELVATYAAKRKALKDIVHNPNATMEERYRAIQKLDRLPRNSAAVRVRNRCALSGRPRGYYRQFGVSRIALRDLSSAGRIPGVRKASW